jgi:uncharacterized phage-associated protein
MTINCKSLKARVRWLNLFQKLKHMKSIDIAKDIAYLCKKNGYEFNNTKIQKLLYLFVGFCLINDVNDVYTIDESPKLWPYGPVFPKVHKKYDSIKDRNGTELISVSDEKTKKILEETVKKWGKVSAGILSAWSHMENSPWDLLVKEGAKWNTEIDLDYIKVYFARMVENVI